MSMQGIPGIRQRDLETGSGTSPEGQQQRNAPSGPLRLFPLQYPCRRTPSFPNSLCGDNESYVLKLRLHAI